MRKAYSFNLKDKDGNSYKLSDFDDDFIVLYFYPKDNTPGCTIEANEFNKALPKFKKLNTKVIGISGGDEKTKQKFCDKHGLKFLLLSDTDFKVSKKYGQFGEKKFMGRTYEGIFRTTFILDKKRNVVEVIEKVKPLGHAKQVLDIIGGTK